MKPAGPKGMTCPFHRRDMSRVCSTCPMWVSIKGTNPQTGVEVDQWECAIAVTPMTVLEAAKQSREAGASVDHLRADFAKAHEQSMRLALSQLAPRPDPTAQIINEVPNARLNSP